MMLACAILNAKSTTSELPLFARDIPAISVDQHTLTWAYTGTKGGILPAQRLLPPSVRRREACDQPPGRPRTYEASNSQTGCTEGQTNRMCTVGCSGCLIDLRRTASSIPHFVLKRIAAPEISSGGGHHIAVTSQSMIEVLVPSLTNPGPVEWDAMGLMDVQRLVFQINCPLIWDATSNDLVSNIELFVRLFLIIFGIFSCNFFLNNYY